MRRSIVLVILILLIGGAGYVLTQRPTREHPGPLILYGSVDVRQVDLAFNAEGRVATMLKEEGDVVAKGDLVATLDKSYLLSAVAVAEGRLEGQRARVAKLLAGSRPEEIDKARADVAEAEAQVVNTTASFRRQEQLSRTRVASEQALDQARAAMTVAVARRDAAKPVLRLATLGPRQEDINAAQADLRSDDATLALARRRLADADLFAPDSGTVLTRIREPGTVVSTGMAVYSLALTTPVWVRAYVSEPELGRVPTGRKVRIKSDLPGGKVYVGQIGFVSPTAEFTPKTVVTADMRTSLVYRLRVVVENSDAALRQGMPVTVELD